MLPSPCFRKESIEGIVTTSDGLVARRQAAGLDALPKASQLPASVADLSATLTKVDANSEWAYICDWGGHKMTTDEFVVVPR